MSSEPSVALRDLSFTYETASGPLFAGLSLHLPRGFTGVVGANGSGKTTLLRIIAGALRPTAGAVEGVRDAVYCDQRTDRPPPQLAALLDDWDSQAFALRGRLEIETDYLARWVTLSHGERKRAQIACALWQRPYLLALDEPTNHIDARARELLVSALRRFDGVGVLVSHDRALLDALVVQCVWLEPPSARVYPGGYGRASELRARERETALRERHEAVRELAQLESELVHRRERAASEHGRRSKRGLARHDADAREKIDRARVTDGKAGAGLRQLQGRAARAQARLDDARVERAHATGIWLPDARSQRDRLFRLEPGTLALGSTRTLGHPDLSMRADERVAVTGVNGAGKSTLVRAILERVNLPAERVLAMPQEIEAERAEQILAEARALPPDRLGQVLNVVSRLGSRPQRLLESRTPSPGEVRKLLLALGIQQAPHLIVLDEPTNHLDLPSIEALESALADCPCGLLLVSHDLRFLDRLTDVHWRVEVDARGDSTVEVDRQ